MREQEQALFASSAQSELEAAEEVSVWGETWNAFNLASGWGERNYLEVSPLVKVGAKIQSLDPVSLGNGNWGVWHADMTLKYPFVSKKGLGEEFPLELIETITFLLQHEESF